MHMQTSFMASMNNQGASSSSFIPCSWTYDVFLSFRGEDTRYGFTGHLHSALLRKGINTFIDNDLTRGDEIAHSLLKVIQESRISIIVFSQHYASSKWCLDELVQIHHCNESKQQMVRPIFYKVDPADVRHQKGSYGEAMAKHERRFHDNLDKVKTWRRALTRSANLSGWHYKDGEYESKFIDNIVEEISIQLLRHTYLDVAEYPVGLDSRVRDINDLLGVGGNGRCIIGIWGTPGIGKTTIAKAVYNSIAHRFEGRCFLENVGEKSESPEGLVPLLETLLFEILGDPNWRLSSVDKGINVIKQRLSNKKVLLVLDDVNKLEWLSKLAGATGLFGEGSRVILTTKNKGLLTRHGIKLVYEVKKLDNQQALELFSWHAFGNNVPPDKYVAFTSRAINYVQCLPLALKVLGSHLGTLETVDRWQATLDSYKSAPYKEIQKPFRICYDALEYEVKEVFLDIACFFNHKEKDFVLEILKDDDLDFPENHIEVLIQSALISLDRFKRISMHNLLEQMGKDIARQESLEPGECKRLWFHKDVVRVLTENSGTNKIKGILVKFPKPNEILLRAKSFSGMTNLKYFINCNASLSGCCGYLPNSLKLIDWGWCQLESFPSNFHPKELIVLNMPFGRITQLGKGLIKYLTKVTSLNFEGCKFLKTIPDLSGLSNMKSLNLRYCTSLLEVDHSVGFLEKLVKLDLEGCANLELFPKRVGWKSLESISLNYCKRLKKFPEIVEKMESLRYIHLVASGIEELPSSIGYLTGLRDLHANRCENLKNLPCSIYELQHLSSLGLDRCPKLVTLPNTLNSESTVGSLALALPTNSNTSQSSVLPELEGLYFEECNLSDFDCLGNLGCFSTLAFLSLSGSSFITLPMCISKFVNLARLELCRCKKLREIVELPPNINCISVVDCISLEIFSLLSQILEHKDISRIRKIDLSNCPRLCDHLGLDVAKMANVLINQVGNSWFETLFPGNEVPKWFNCRKDVCVPVGDSETDQLLCELVVQIPHSFKWEYTGLVLCVVFESTEEYDGDCCFFKDKFTINGHSMGPSSDAVFYTSREAGSPHVWLKYISLPGFLKPKLDRESPSMPYMCRIILRLLGTGLLIKSCGVHLAYVPHDDDGDQLENEDDEEFYSCLSADANDDADAEEVNSDCLNDQRASANDVAKELLGDTRLGLKNPKKRTWADYIDEHLSGPASPSATVPKK